MSDQGIRVRFAPSPTGYFHIGSARVALFNYLFAKKNKGTFVLRIEDTDKERSTKEYEKDIMENLEWIGVNWDEGAVPNGDKGDAGPYRQSERGEIYKKYLQRLLDEGKAYYCFCEKEKLEEMRREQRERKEPPRYDGDCFSLDDKEKEKLIEEGKDFTIRLKIPESKTVEFHDKIRGKVSFNTDDMGGDFVIAKKDMSPLYNFACVVDDHEMKATHVIRGEDHVSNTPKQILIQEALGFFVPEFAHLPLILGPDKSKLSKRHGTVSLSSYREKGYLPEALVNFIALLGWHPGTEEEILTLEKIIEEFELEDCQKSGAIFDTKKLDHINGHYIRKRNPEDLAAMCIPYLVEKGFLEVSFEEDQYPPAYGGKEPRASYFAPLRKKEMSFEEIKEIVSLYQERMKVLSEAGELMDYLFGEIPSYEKELLFFKDATKEELIESLDNISKVLSNIKEWSREVIEEEMVKVANEARNRGVVLWPTRVALSGKKASAPPFDIAHVLGREETLKRIEKAKEKLQ